MFVEFDPVILPLKIHFKKYFERRKNSNASRYLLQYFSNCKGKNQKLTWIKMWKKFRD
jgi:hypothetical protein